MTARNGFGRADIDTNLYNDPKTVALHRRLRDHHRTLEALGLYLAAVLASWTAGRPLSVGEAAPAWWLGEDDEYLPDLLAVGLVDADGRVPEHAFAAWTARARAASEASQLANAARWTKWREEHQPEAIRPDSDRIADAVPPDSGRNPDAIPRREGKGRKGKEGSTSARAARAPAAQQDDRTWAAWGDEWTSFRAAWRARGYRLPPTPKQRAALWDAADAQPTNMARWVAEAPTGARAAEVVGYVLRRWHAIRDAEPEDQPTAPADPTPAQAAAVVAQLVPAARHTNGHAQADTAPQPWVAPTSAEDRARRRRQACLGVVEGTVPLGVAEAGEYLLLTDAAYLAKGLLPPDLRDEAVAS